MKKTLESISEHVHAFYTTGSYSIQNNIIDLYSELPDVVLEDSNGNGYKLELKYSKDISTNEIPCMLCIYQHGHPTNREMLIRDSFVWKNDQISISSVFLNTNFPLSKVLVITIHDEDFEEWHASVYKFFVQHYVNFNSATEAYEFDITMLTEFINGTATLPNGNEEPRTVGGGVLEPVI